MDFSGVTTSRRRLAIESTLQFYGLLNGLFDRSDHVERLLRQFVMFALENFAEAADGVLDLHEFSLQAGELLCHEHRLRQEALDAASAPNDQLVFFRKLVHAENRDDVLEVFIALERLLNPASDAVVLVAHNFRRKDPARRIERIYGREEAELCNRTAEVR